jgi:serine protease Do
MTESDTGVSTAGESRSKTRYTRPAIVLACVAGLGIAAALGGPIAWQEFTASARVVSPYSEAAAARPSEAAVARPVGFADVVAKVRPAVISVRVKIEGVAGQIDDSGDDSAGPRAPGSPPGKSFRQFGAPKEPNGETRGRQIMIGQGSDFFISADGYAVTNNHVVDGAETVDVTTSDGSFLHAKVIGTDQKIDLALIKVDGADNFPYVAFSDNAPRVGDWALAVGNPFGLGGTVTAGIVSANGRDIGEGPYDDFIQLDAPINKGNSGGPTFDVDGNVMGVNTAIYSPSGGSVGIGFAAPADTAKAVIAQLKDKGVVRAAGSACKRSPSIRTSPPDSVSRRRKGRWSTNPSRIARLPRPELPRPWQRRRVSGLPSPRLGSTALGRWRADCAGRQLSCARSASRSASGAKAGQGFVPSTS